jgi:hypothetical protein
MRFCQTHVLRRLLMENIAFAIGKVWRYDRPQALALIKRGLDQSLPVYALFVSQREMSEQQSRLPALPGYQWAILASSTEAVILELAPAESGETAPPEARHSL